MGPDAATAVMDGSSILFGEYEDTVVSNENAYTESESTRTNGKRPFEFPKPSPAPLNSNPPIPGPIDTPIPGPIDTPIPAPIDTPIPAPINIPIPAPIDTDAPTTVNPTTDAPTAPPGISTTDTPTTPNAPTDSPTTDAPTTSPPTTDPLAYRPGVLTTIENGLYLSHGLKSRVIAISNQKVRYHNGDQSSLRFHDWPDGGDVFPDKTPGNEGGWIYVSNAEEDRQGKGGVGAITFDAEGNVLEYKMILTGTTMNCNGGATHFGGWVSCEEDFWSAAGRCWLTDPSGNISAKPISLGSDGGIFEAFAYDIRDKNVAHFFVTEDDQYGAMQRWTPDNPDWNDPWQILLGSGTTDYLVLTPQQNNQRKGTFDWTTDKDVARNSAADHYPNSEGIAITGNTLYFVCKRYGHLFTLDLDTFTYTRRVTRKMFDGGPDQLKFVPNADPDHSMLYFTEDGGDMAGIHARGANGHTHTILEGEYEPETTGLGFSPDGKRMYFSFQEDGIVFEITRLDGQPFHGITLNVKTHQYEGSSLTPSRRQKRDRNRHRHLLSIEV